MATNLETKINRIQTAVTNALAAVGEKGVTVPSGAGVDALAGLIAAIEAGGSGGDVFIAQYGVTTFAEIAEAIEAGKLPMLHDDGYYASLVVYEEDWIQFAFTRSDLNYLYSFDIDGTYSKRELRLARDEEGVPEADYNGNDDGKVLTVSGNKAVWKNVVLTDEDKTEIAQIAVGLLPKYAGEVENA